MQKDWRDLTYLLHGTVTQQAAYQALEALRVFALLSPFDPLLAGTIPLDIDIPGSDLDIVCCAADVDAFAQHLHDTFGQCDTCGLQHTVMDGLPTVIGQCTSQGLLIEIFGQPRPVTEQKAVRHMIVEERLLRHGGAEVRRQIRHLKSQGLKTEPAFAVVFRLPGDPYQTLVQLAGLEEEALVAVITPVSPLSRAKRGANPSWKR